MLCSTSNAFGCALCRSTPILAIPDGDDRPIFYEVCRILAEARGVDNHYVKIRNDLSLPLSKPSRWASPALVEKYTDECNRMRSLRRFGVSKTTELMERIARMAAPHNPAVQRECVQYAMADLLKRKFFLETRTGGLVDVACESLTKKEHSCMVWPRFWS